MVFLALDIQSQKNRISEKNPTFNLVPFIDILFTILIFIILTSNLADPVAEVTDIEDATNTGKPNVTDTSGSAEYYVVPISNLEKVTVNGQDMSHLIKNSAIGVQSRVMDEGQITIKPGQIIITTPPGVSPDVAVKSPA